MPVGTCGGTMLRARRYGRRPMASHVPILLALGKDMADD